MRAIQSLIKFVQIFALHWQYHWWYHHPETSQKVQAMRKIECLRDKARFRIKGSDGILRELLVFSPKEDGHNKDFLFLMDDMTNTYAAVPEGW